MIFASKIPKLNPNHMSQTQQDINLFWEILPLCLSTNFVLKIPSDWNKIRYRQSVQDKNENLKEFSVQGAALTVQWNRKLLQHCCISNQTQTWGRRSRSAHVWTITRHVSFTVTWDSLVTCSSQFCFLSNFQKLGMNPNLLASTW